MGLNNNKNATSGEYCLSWLEQNKFKKFVRINKFTRERYFMTPINTFCKN